jgi:hypothetical protein
MWGMQLDRFATLAWGALAVSVAAALGFGAALLLGGFGKAAAPAATGHVARAHVESAKDLARRERVAQRRLLAAERLPDTTPDRRARADRDAGLRARRVAAARRLARQRAAARTRSRRATVIRPPVVQPRRRVVPRPPPVATPPRRHVVVAPPPPPHPPPAPRRESNQPGGVWFDDSN